VLVVLLSDDGPAVKGQRVEEALLFLLDASSRLRHVPHFLDYVLRAVEEAGVDRLDLGAAFRRCLARCVQQMPPSQNLILWNGVGQVLRRQAERFRDHPQGDRPLGLHPSFLDHVALIEYSPFCGNQVPSGNQWNLSFIIFFRISVFLLEVKLSHVK